MTETQLSRQIREALNLLPGVYVFRVNAGGYRGRSQGAPAGTPDLVGWCSVELSCTGGWCSVELSCTGETARFFALEVKKPKEKLSPAQIDFAAKAAQAGAFTACVHSVAEAMEAVKRCRDGE